MFIELLYKGEVFIKNFTQITEITKEELDDDKWWSVSFYYLTDTEYNCYIFNNINDRDIFYERILKLLCRYNPK